MATERATICFNDWRVFDCELSCKPKHMGLNVKQVMDLATKGRTTCRGCGKQGSPYDWIKNFPVFGHPEAMFGLDVWWGRQTFEPQPRDRIEMWDISSEIPHGGTVLYMNQTASASTPGTAPRLLVGQNNPMQPYLLQLAIHVPASREQTALGITFVLSPKDPPDLPLDLAVQAVGAFHRRQFNMAGVLLGASIEATLRDRVKKEYTRRGVNFDDRKGAATLLELARLLVNPVLGANLLNDLAELFAEARNPAAHGSATNLREEQITKWMVAAAIVYEWSRLATSVYPDPATPKATPAPPPPQETF
jgi:hypothetical protein